MAKGMHIKKNILNSEFKNSEINLFYVNILQKKFKSKKYIKQTHIEGNFFLKRFWSYKKLTLFLNNCFS